MNYFADMLKTPSIVTTDNDVQKILEKREQQYVDAETKINEINNLMKEGLTQEEAFKKVIEKS